MMAKIDRRILRTRRYLGEAFIRLIEKKGYQAVTIRDITDHADVAYATFFRHYGSKQALLMEQLEKVLQTIEAEASTHENGYFVYEGQLLFEHFKANHVLYRGLLDHMDVIRALKQMISENIRPHVTAIYAQYENPVLPLELLVNHSVSSLLSLVTWWLENDMLYSTEDMAVYYELLVIQSGWGVVDKKGHDSSVPFSLSSKLSDESGSRENMG